MFTNTQTLLIEVLVVVATVIFLGVLIGRYIYRKTHNLPTGECECCHKSKDQLLKEYHKKYGK